MSANIEDIEISLQNSLIERFRAVEVTEEKIMNLAVPAFRLQGDIERSVPVYLVPSRVEHQVEQYASLQPVRFERQDRFGDEQPVADMVWR